MPRALSFGLAAMLIAGSASAQISLTPRILRLDALTCQELLALSGEQRDHLLMYLNGYFDGGRGALTWDERQAGERIDRVLAQ
jgi:HdeA/HdeB family